MGILATTNVSEAFAYNGDMQCYVSNILKFRYGILCHDYHYALNLPSFGYGGGMFLFLALITFPITFLTNNEQLILIIVRCTNVFALLGTVYILNLIVNKYTNKDNKNFHLYVGLISILPSTLLLITRIHPEIFQLFWFCTSIFLLMEWIEKKGKKYLIGSAITSGIMVGCKVSGFIFLIFHFIIIITAKKELKKKLTDLILWGIIFCPIMFIFVRPEILLSPRNGLGIVNK